MRKMLVLGLALSMSAVTAFAQTATPAQTPAAPAAQTAGSFTGKWEGTFTRQRTDGQPGTADQCAFDLTQAGKALTGTAGPPTEQLKIVDGAVVAGKATFKVVTPTGRTFSFSLAIVKDRLQGDMVGEQDGKVIGTAKVDAGRAKAAK
jgi:hypothetical protein